MISVIMPMRNAAPFVRASLATVLAQDVELEVIVVDDGSTDSSADVVGAIGDERVRIIAGPQRGIAAAFNAGLAAARGEFVARCDADDFYRSGRLKRQQIFLNAHPAFVAVCAGYAYLDARGRFGIDVLRDDGLVDVTDELLAGEGRSHMCAYLFRTNALRAVGGCREWFVTSEDADLQYRLAAFGRIAYEPFDAYGYRLHDASITHTSQAAKKRWYGDCAKQFLDQRNAGGADDLMRGFPPEFTSQGISGIESGGGELTDRIITRSWQHQRAGARRAAWSVGWRAVRLAPTCWRAWRNLVLLAIK